MTNMSLQLTTQLILEFFKPAVTSTVNYIHDALQSCPVVEEIVLVGGFAQSVVLQGAYLLCVHTCVCLYLR